VREVDDYRANRAFYVPSSGRVLSTRGSFDRKTEFLSHAARRGMQGNFSIRRNDPGKCGFCAAHAREKEILAACQIARVDEFAESFENKVRDGRGPNRGVKLSAGRSSACRLRARFSRPRILSSMRPLPARFRVEALIRRAALSDAGRTTFVIAHRLSTIRRADQSVVEAGAHHRTRTHDRSMRSRPLLRPLYEGSTPIEANLFLAPGGKHASKATIQTRRSGVTANGRGEPRSPTPSASFAANPARIPFAMIHSARLWITVMLLWVVVSRNLDCRSRRFASRVWCRSRRAESAKMAIDATTILLSRRNVARQRASKTQRRALAGRSWPRTRPLIAPNFQ